MIELLNRVVYIGFGLLLSWQILQLTTEKTVEEESATIVVEDFNDNSMSSHSEQQSNSISEEKLKQLIAQVIRQEVKAELESFLTLRKNDSYLSAPEKKSGNEVAHVRSEEEVNKQKVSYEAANQLIDSAIELNSWSSDNATQLLNHLGELSADQSMRIRAKYANAVNEGLIVADKPLSLQTF